MTILVLRFNQTDVHALQKVEVKPAASRKSKSGGGTESGGILAIDAKRGKTKRGQTLERNPECRTGRERIDGVNVSKMIASFNDATEILVRPIGGSDGKSGWDSLGAIDRPIWIQVRVTGKNIDFGRLILIRARRR